MAHKIDRETAALTIYAGVCCTIAASFVFALHGLMQPTRMKNPGLAAYKPPPGTIIDLTPTTRPPELTYPVPAAMELAAEVVAPPAVQKPVEAKNLKAGAKIARPKRQRSAHRSQPHKGINEYAYQPFFGGYRPWY